MLFLHPAPCLCGREHGEMAPKRCRSPRSEPGSPKGHRDHHHPTTTTPRAKPLPEDHSPVPLPRGSSPLGRATTDRSLQDPWRRPPAESGTEPPGQGQTWGLRGGLDTHHNKGCHPLALNTTSVPCSRDRARCKALPSLRTILPLLTSTLSCTARCHPSSGDGGATRRAGPSPLACLRLRWPQQPP